MGSDRATSEQSASTEVITTTTTHCVPWVNTIREPGRLPIAHYTDPTQTYDSFTAEPDPAGEWIKTDCGVGFAPAHPNDHYVMCKTCEAKGTPDSTLVLVDCTWGARNGL